MSSLKLTFLALFILVATSVSAKRCQTQVDCIENPCKGSFATCSKGVCECAIRIDQGEDGECNVDDDCKNKLFVPGCTNYFCEFGACFCNKR
ncbi:hypothetical protein ABFS83_12G085800 [Erythranthe nasuta]